MTTHDPDVPPLNGTERADGHYNYCRLYQPLRPVGLKHGRKRIRLIHGVYVLKSTRDPRPTLLVGLIYDDGEINSAPLHRIHYEYEYNKPALANLALICRTIYDEKPPKPIPLEHEPPARTKPRTLTEALEQLCDRSKGKAAPCGLRGCEAPDWGGCARRKKPQ